MTYYYNPAAGVQNPSKYAPYTVGPNYKKYGEQGGYYYDPTSDTYHKDPNAQKKLLQSQGIVEADPEQASLTDTLGPLAAVSAVSAGVPSLIKEGIGLLHATPVTPVGNGTAIATEAAAMQNLGSLGGGAGTGVAQGGTAVGEQALLDSSFLGETGAGAEAGSGGLIGSGGSFFNTNGMIGPQGSFGVGNALGALGGGLLVFDASQSGNKTRGIGEGLLGGGMAGFSIGGPIGAAIGAPIGGLLGATAHESTSDRTQRRYSELPTSDNATFEAMKQKGLDWSLSGEDTWDIGDDKSAAPIDNMANSYGVLKTFGPEWTQYSDEQRHNIVQGLVNADKINSKQGEYLIDDPDGAKEIAQSIAGAPAGVSTTTSSSGSGGGTTTTTTSEGDIMPGLLTSTPAVETKKKKRATLSQAPAVMPIATRVTPGGLL